ncbi:MAG: tol-pal system protein YbgF [Gemmatimonadota bacterium]
MTGRRLALVVLAVSALAAAGCASGTRVGTRSAADRDGEIARLKERVLEIQRRLSVTEVEVDRLRREVARLKGAPIEEGARVVPPGEESTRSMRSTRSGERAGSGAVAADATDGSGRDFEIEDLGEPSPGPPDAPPRAVEETPDEETSGRGRMEPPGQPDRQSAARPAPSSAGGADELTDEAQALYDRGYALYHQGRFVDAESTFQQFLQAHAGTELADNAQYWIGEARFARGDMKGALSAFREVARRFPDGNKVPDALLKAGETQAATGDSAGARETYREVIRTFPGTTAAAVAQDRLADLG